MSVCIIQRQIINRRSIIRHRSVQFTIVVTLLGYYHISPRQFNFFQFLVTVCLLVELHKKQQFMGHKSRNNQSMTSNDKHGISLTYAAGPSLTPSNCQCRWTFCNGIFFSYVSVPFLSLSPWNQDRFLFPVNFTSKTNSFCIDRNLCVILK